MDSQIQKYLIDIKQCIEEIEGFLDLKSRQFEVYLNDTMFRRAIERNISIIGEAMTKILQLHPNIHITDAKNIKRCRNYIVHAYDSLDSTIMWAVVIKDLPILKADVEALLISGEDSTNEVTEDQ